MKIQNKVFSSISLATKAGKVTGGEFLTETSIKEGKAKLVVVANDASDNTKKKFRNSCEYYSVPILFLGSKKELGRMTGKEYRASIAVLDQGFADMIQRNNN